MRQRRRGQADLLYRKQADTFFLAVTVDAPEPTPDEASDYLGVDLGVITLAATSDGALLNHAAGSKRAHSNQLRARSVRFRRKLQTKENKVGQAAVEEAQRPRTALCQAREPLFVQGQCADGARHCARECACEDLQGIGERISTKRTVAKRRRRVLHRWAFGPLRTCIAYKARLAGGPVVYVHPASTSQTCSRCGHCARATRTSHAKFRCVACGVSAPADLHAAEHSRRAAVIPPDAAALAG